MPRTPSSRSPIDPLTDSLLPPFVRARCLLEHVGSLSRHGWDEALQASFADDGGARRAAKRRVAGLVAAHAQSRAFDALVRVAQDAARAAGSTRCVARDLEGRAASLAADAAFALVLRDQLAPRDFEALYAPFARASLADAVPRARGA